MGNPSGFKQFTRQSPTRRPVELRVLDWHEIYLPMPESDVKKQGARCMDCGVPFCNNGCPLGNPIPDFNDSVYRGRWREAFAALSKTNNFPEWTGRICPAPCEEACVLTINDRPVTIKTIEQSISDRAWSEGWITPQPPTSRTGKNVAIIGSGPAGLAAAAQLNRAGHKVVVFERDDRPGGLLLYGIPDFKMDKSTVSRRVSLMEDEGIEFRCNIEVGTRVTIDSLRSEFDAIVLAIGACAPREVAVAGRELSGVHYAMEFLPQSTHANLGDAVTSPISASGKHVIIIGGGDTAADCLGTALRQGAASIKQFDINPKPPAEHNPSTPWPNWQLVLRSSAAHEEGACQFGEDVRDFGILTKAFVDNGSGGVKALRTIRIESHKDAAGIRHVTEIAGSEVDHAADLVLIAIGFTGPEKRGPIESLGLALDRRGNVQVDQNYQTTLAGVFCAGDARRGQSLVVWAISEGRQAARCCDEFLMGVSDLPKLELL